MDLAFDAFRLDRRRQTLWRGTTTVHLRRKTWEVLCYLSERPAQIVSKDELLAAIWGDVTVSDHMVQISINELRKALGDDAREPRFIETVHRRGFRWIASLLPAATFSTDPPVVGRERELARLEEKWNLALGGRRQIVFLSGDAGIGKTTLAMAFVDALAGTSAAPPLVGRGHCAPQSGSSEAFLPILEALTSMCERPAFIEVLHRHAPGWLAHIPSALDAGTRERLWRDTAGMGAEQSLRLVAEALEAASREAPLLIVLEDVHWADPSTVHLVDLLAQRSGAARFLLLCTYRPIEAIIHGHPMRERVQSLRARRLAEEISVPPLAPAAIRELVRRRFPDAPFELELTQWLQDRGGGHPLFLFNLLEDIVQEGVVNQRGEGWWLDADLDARAVPETNQLLVHEHFGRLGCADQSLLMAASILDREASAAALAAILDADLISVERRASALAARGDILCRRDDLRLPDGTAASAYDFIHAVYREVIYQQIPRAEAARLHLRHAQWLARIHVARLDAVAEQLALHYELGGDYVEAVKHLRTAAARSIERSAPANAAAVLARALRLLQLSGCGEADIEVILVHIEYARALQQVKGLGHPDAEAAVDTACRLTDLAPESPLLALAAGGCAYLHFMRAHFAQAESLSRRALALAAPMQLPLATFHAEASLATVLRRTGALTEARERFERALAVEGVLLREMRPDMRTASLGAFAQTLMLLGYPDQARRVAREAIERAEASGFAYDRIWALFQSAELAMYLEQRDAALRQAQAAAELAERHGFPFWATAAGGILGWVQINDGEIDRGLAVARKGADLCRGHELAMQYSISLRHFAGCLLTAGRFDECDVTVREALQLVEANGDRMVEPELWRLRAELEAQTQARPQEVESHLRRAIETARRQQARWWELRALDSWARLCAPPPADLRRELEPLLEMWHEGTDLELVRCARARLSDLTMSHRSRRRRNI